MCVGNSIRDHIGCRSRGIDHTACLNRCSDISVKVIVCCSSRVNKGITHIEIHRVTSYNCDDRRGGVFSSTTDYNTAWFCSGIAIRVSDGIGDDVGCRNRSIDRTTYLNSCWDISVNIILRCSSRVSESVTDIEVQRVVSCDYDNWRGSVPTCCIWTRTVFINTIIRYVSCTGVDCIVVIITITLLRSKPIIIIILRTFFYL